MRIFGSHRAVLLFSQAASAQQAKPITIATEGAFPPWNHTEAGGKVARCDVEIAQDLCRRTQISCTIVGQDWAGIIRPFRPENTMR
jgi:octopine/nopaline transport system substrate-binding protein